MKIIEPIFDSNGGSSSSVMCDSCLIISRGRFSQPSEKWSSLPVIKLIIVIQLNCISDIKIASEGEGEAIIKISIDQSKLVDRMLMLKGLTSGLRI
jgi:hypothetical protein